MSDWQNMRQMTPREYQRSLDYLGINPGQAARWLGVSNRTSYRYRDGDTDIPAAQVLLLRTFVEYKIKPAVPPYVKGQF